MIRRRKMLKTAELYLLMELVDGTSLDVQRPNSLVSLIPGLSAGWQWLGGDTPAGLCACGHEAEQYSGERKAAGEDY